MNTAIILAAGKGSRMGAGINKVYMHFNNKPLILYSVEAFLSSGCFDKIVIVTGEEDIENCINLTKNYHACIEVLKGSDTRQKSVMCGLMACSGSNIVSIHDGARALITPELIKKVFEETKKHKLAAPGVISKDTLKQVDEDGFIKKTIDREKTYHIQTPQMFDYNIILQAHKKAIEKNIEATDDSMLAEIEGMKVKMVESSYDNIKITTPEDIYMAENILKNKQESGGIK